MKKKVPAKKTPPRKTSPPSPSRKAAAKKAPAKRRPAAKKAAATKKRPAGGTVSTVRATAKAGARATIPDGAVVVLSDAEFGKQVLEELKRTFDPPRICREFENLLSATSANKHGEPMIDGRARLAALEKVVYLTVGKPIDRKETVQTTVWSYEEIEALIGHSRELRVALRSMLAPFDQADAEDAT